LNVDTSALLFEAIRQAHVGVVIADLRWHVVSANDATCELLGAEESELAGRNLLRALASRQDRPWLREMLATLEKGQAWRGRVSETTRWGLPISIDASIGRVLDPDGSPVAFAVVVQDISRERHLELQLLQSQRLEAMGQLAGGVAHNFNNLLQTIENSLHLIRATIADPDRIRRQLSQIRTTLRSGQELVRQLLAFGRQQTLAPEPVRLGELVRELEPMLRRTIPESIILRLELPPPQSDPVVETDSQAMHQVLLNLCLNARDAMPDGGKITISTATNDSTHHAELAVTDTGTGIPRDVLEHVFEPFYTTKGQGGSGLGLATVDGIVSQCGGTISVTTAIGRGTTFKITLPLGSGLTPVDAASLVRREESGAHTPVGGARVLLVEDDAGVRESLAEILSSYNYDLRSAASGAEALATLDCEPSWRPEILVSDLKMPGISGQELAMLLAERFPTLKVVLASGYHPDSVPQLPNLVFLDKPFSIGELLEVLDRFSGGRS
jgi:two-component system cell cycle sensor histidine kinase/response regulator CckA